MTLISDTITLPSPLPHPGRRNEAGPDERGVKEQIRLSPPFPLQSAVLQTPQAELGFSTLNPIKPLIPPAGMTLYPRAAERRLGASGLGY